MSAANSRYHQGANLYLNHFTVGLVYEGVKEIIYNEQHLRLYPGTLFCLGFANHQVRNNPDSHNNYAEIALDYTYEELAEIRLVDMPQLDREPHTAPVSRMSLIRSTTADMRIREIFDSVRYEAESGEMSKTKRMATLFLLLSADGSDTILTTILDNLDERLLLLESAIRQETAAESVNLSANTYNKLCLLKFGVTPRALHLQSRLNKAKWALQLDETPIADIASSCGFKDCSYFTKVFKQHFGLTPRQFRANTRRNMGIVE